MFGHSQARHEDFAGAGVSGYYLRGALCPLLTHAWLVHFTVCVCGECVAIRAWHSSLIRCTWAQFGVLLQVITAWTSRGATTRAAKPQSFAFNPNFATLNSHDHICAHMHDNSSSNLFLRSWKVYGRMRDEKALFPNPCLPWWPSSHCNPPSRCCALSRFSPYIHQWFVNNIPINMNFSVLYPLWHSPISIACNSWNPSLILLNPSIWLKMCHLGLLG